MSQSEEESAGEGLAGCWGSRAAHLAELLQVLPSVFPFSLAVAAAALAWMEPSAALPPARVTLREKVQGDRGDALSAAPELWGSADKAIPRNGELVWMLGWEKSWGPLWSCHPSACPGAA